MIKKPENKTRKRLRITQCVLYLFQIVFCFSFSFIHIPDPSNANAFGFHATVMDMLGYLGGTFPESAAGSNFQSILPLFLIFPVVPIIGFFFCALDKQRNLKNIVSIICCLIGVFSILNMITLNFLDYGSTFALLNYILISFITTIAIMARLDNTQNK